MATRLYIMRHGPAEERNEALYPDDRLRPLTSAGARKTRRVARGLRALNCELDHMFTSPLLRARQTADIVAKGVRFPLDQIIDTESLVPDADPAKLFELDGLARNDHSALIVGHEPYLSTLISWLLTGDRQGLRVTFKTPAVCLIDLEVSAPLGRGVLRWLLQPRQLIRAGR